jgi:hypothetical protein
MAMSDKDGIIEGSAVGIAPIARVSVEACKKAIEILESPDENSRSKEYEGRRLLPIEGGWKLVNHEKYKNLARSRAAYYQAWREQRKQQIPPVPLKNAICPSLQQVKDECFKQGMPDTEAELLHANYAKKGWVDGNNIPIIDLVACVTQWRLRKPEFDAKKPTNEKLTPPTSRLPTYKHEAVKLGDIATLAQRQQIAEEAGLKRQNL